MKIILNIADDTDIGEVLYLLDEFANKHKELFREIAIKSI